MTGHIFVKNKKISRPESLEIPIHIPPVFEQNIHFVIHYPYGTAITVGG